MTMTTTARGVGPARDKWWRTLHLIDVENVAGMARPTETQVGAALARYRAAVRVGPSDQIVIAANLTTAAWAKWAWPGALVRAASGPDGADLALLGDADPDHVARRFQRVVIASGDHVFTERARELRARGLHVEVLARPGALSHNLRGSADVVRLLPDVMPVAA
jgi:hypothetical protein